MSASSIESDKSLALSSGLGRALRRLLLLPAVAAVGGLGLIVMGFWLASDSPSFHEHALGHWVMGMPVLFVALAIMRLPEARTTPRRIARLFVTVLLVALAAAFLLEGLGAFASGKGPVGNLLSSMHRLGEATTLFSMLALPLAFVLLALVYSGAAMSVLIGRLSSPKGT